MSDVTTVSQGGIDPWVGFMERAMRDPNFDTNKLAALLEMRHREMEQQRIERAEERKRIFSEALTSFQGEVDPIVRDAINPFLKNKYATLQKTVETAQPYMKKYGLNVRYVSADAPPGWLKMGVILGHDCGYEDEPFMMSVQTTDTGSKGGKLPMTPSQAVAATMTFLRRQLYTNALNLVAGEIEPDDDGEALRGTARDSRADAYSAPRPPRQPERTEEQWRVFLTKLREACAVLRLVSELDEVANRSTLNDAIAVAPEWVREEINEILADTRERLIKPAETIEKPDDELPPIAGEDKVMAGD
jgi:uncharacterized membrane protein